MQIFKIADALKGFTVLDDEPMERAFDKVVRCLTVPLSQSAEEVVGNCVDLERSISGCLDTGLVLADPGPAEVFSSTLILALGVYRRAIPWRWEDGSSHTGTPALIAHFVLVVLSPDGKTRLRALRASSRIFAADHEPGRSILSATSLEHAVALVLAFEDSGQE